MPTSYLKAATAFTAVLLTIGFVAAQPSNPAGDKKPDNTDSKKPEDVGKTSNGKGMIPDLPSQASSTAKQVTSTIDSFIGGGIDGVSSLGEALNGLLGVNTEAEPNQTDNGTQGEAA